MKVLHFSSLDGQTGAGVAAARIHCGLLDRSVASRFCVAYPAAGLPEAFTPAISPPGRIARSVRVRQENRLLSGHPEHEDYVASTGRLGFDMTAVIAAERPDIVQLHWIGGRSFRLASLKGVEAPIVWRLSDQWPFCGLQHLEPDPFAYVLPPQRRPDDHWADLSERVRLEKQAVYSEVANLTLACPSRWIAAEAKRSALLKDRPMERIPTSCDTELFTHRDRIACRRALGLPEDEALVLVGATSLGTKWKGLDLFVEAMRKVGPKAAGRKVRVVTFGQDVLGASGLGDVVGLTHLGAVRDRRLMAILYAAADVFVAPSRMENLANTVLESLACGTPVAAFSIGGMPDMIDDRVNGTLAAPFEPSALADGIGWALERRDDPKVRAAAREKILSEFTIEREVTRYLSLYERLLERAA